MTITQSTDHLKRISKTTGNFYFKQFKVEDGLSTMKVGTDAVLLGAVTDAGSAANILEIGTGCGVIAIILAQRSKAVIDAIEIDEESVKQAKVNVCNSPWKDRITIIHSSLQDFINHTEKRYDLIVSNPPFFSSSLKSPSEKRNLSCHNDLLSYDELISGSFRVMAPDASLWVILPERESSEFINKALISVFFIHTTIKVIPRSGKAFHRIILQLKKTPAERLEEKTLTIKTTNNSYSSEYMEVTKEFYLDF